MHVLVTWKCSFPLRLTNKFSSNVIPHARVYAMSQIFKLTEKLPNLAYFDKENTKCVYHLLDETVVVYRTENDQCVHTSKESRTQMCVG